ncbi:MAG: hypothetical protein CMM60_05230 [Rhodospirillaceae bacterium]|jgi:hypothetical protein|nr:hypothetical protein [Rhodospirillaceae bacterium]|tara:strand:+ start:2537 stop:3139 length:603 start_codon:yes stop_codon:yes gene_type:complete
MEIIVTDVTDMSDGYVCVAGWSTEEGRMVRPLHAAGHPHWAANMAHDDLFYPGNIITVEPSGQPPQRGAPHRTEDTLIAGDPALSGKLSHEDMVGTVSGSVFPTVRDLFGEELSESKFVPEGTGVRSLGAVEIPSRRVRFIYGKYGYTCRFEDHDGETYSLKITSRAVHEEGIDDLAKMAGTVHIRLGFANPWDGLACPP